MSDSEKGVAKLVLEKADSEDQSTAGREQNNNISTMQENIQVCWRKI